VLRNGFWAIVAVVVAAGVSPAAARAANVVPTCEGRAFSVAPDGSRSVPLPCSDRDQQAPLTVAVGTAEHGTVGLPQYGRVRYTPDPGFSGTDHLTFRASDGEDESANAVHELRVTSDNQAPICTTSPLRAVGGQLDPWGAAPCYDPDAGDAVTLALADPAPQHGTASIDGADQLRYTAGTYRGADAVTVRAGDGTVITDPITIPIDSIDLAPVACAAPGTIGVRPGEERSVRLRCGDNVGNAGLWSFERLEEPLHGSLASDMFGRWTYTPDQGFTGLDQATVRPVSLAGGEAVELQFHVTPGANEPPQCVTWGGVTVRPGRPITVLSCEDPDGDPLTYTVLDAPDRGTFNAGSGFASYTANAGQGGSDTFTVRAGDGIDDSGPVTVPVRVIPEAENHAPYCDGLAEWGVSGGQVLGGLTCGDEESDPLTYAHTEPAHGDLTVGPAFPSMFNFQADSGFVGEDGFTFTAGDGRATSAPADARLIVAAREGPICSAASTSAAVRSGLEANISVFCSSRHPATLTTTILDEPDHGTASATFGGVSYRSVDGYDGTDSLTLRVANDAGHVDMAFTFTVSPGHNTPPRCTAQGAPVTRQAPKTVALSCYDAESDPLTLHAGDAPHGTVDAVDQGARTVLYTPDAGYLGTDTFPVWASDAGGAGPTAAQKVTVRSAAGNGVPYCQAGYWRGLQGSEPATVSVQCTDPDGDPITIEVTKQPEHGTLTATGPAEFSYAPDDDFPGEDRFEFVAKDGHGGTSPTRFIGFTRGGAEGGPLTCSPIAFAAEPGVPRSAQLTCRGALAPTYEIVSQPGHGTLGPIGAGGVVTYTPDASFTGTDTFTYRGRSGPAVSDVVTATVTVARPVADAPQPPPAAAGPTPPPTPFAPFKAPPAPGPKASPADLAVRALGGPVLKVKTVAGVDVFRPRKAVRLKGKRVTLAALVCPKAACSANVTLTPGGRQAVRFAAGRPGLVLLDPRKARRKKAVKLALTVGKAKATFSVPVR
jgi:hypothetical protein